MKGRENNTNEQDNDTNNAHSPPSQSSTLPLPYPHRASSASPHSSERRNADQNSSCAFSPPSACFPLPVPHHLTVVRRNPPPSLPCRWKSLHRSCHRRTSSLEMKCLLLMVVLQSQRTTEIAPIPANRSFSIISQRNGKRAEG